MASAWLVAGSGAFVTMFAMVIAMIPPSGESHRTLFFAKVLGGALLFIGFGGFLYWRGARKAATNARTAPPASPPPARPV